MTVRTGPSKRARPYKSRIQNGNASVGGGGTVHFRFECGEFLRASEILTIHGHADLEEKEDNGEVITHPSESFAKLYRNKSIKGQQANVKKLDSQTLSSYTAPGEWVHVHCNGNLYLEECVNPPSIRRDHEGWRYEVVHEAGVEILTGPSHQAKATGSTIQCQASVLVNEEVCGAGEIVTWLRLKDGRGFIHNIGDDGQIFVRKKELIHTKKSGSSDGSYKLISRLFNPP